MINWWNSLTTTQQIFALIAIPSTVVIIIQTILLLIGLGDGGDADIDSDGVVDGVDGDGLALFSVRGIMTMLAVMGWSGMALLETALPEGVSILIAVVLGLFMLVLMAYIMKLISKLQSSGNIDVGNTIGKVAQVYIPIAPNGEKSGKVTLTVQEKYAEFNAITTANQTLRTGAYVRVVAVDESGTLVVEPIGGNTEK
ncbi:MAG TPA: hypothetical protein GX011_05060 [Clostridiales bacterium]|nr:hypothetical protein [Clostridiales bacterium]